MKIQNISSQNFTSSKAYSKLSNTIFDPHDYPREFSNLNSGDKLNVIYDLLKSQEREISSLKNYIKILSKNQAEMHQFNVESTYVQNGLYSLSADENLMAKKEIDEIKSRVYILA